MFSLHQLYTKTSHILSCLTLRTTCVVQIRERYTYMNGPPRTGLLTNWVVILGNLLCWGVMREGLT